MATATTIVEIVIRRNIETGEPELFMIEAGQLTCYSSAEGFSAASREYFLESCRPCSARDADARRLIEQWDNIGHRCAFRVMRRLKWWTI